MSGNSQEEEGSIFSGMQWQGSLVKPGVRLLIASWYRFS